MTKKEEAQKAKEMKALYLELIALMLKRAGLRRHLQSSHKVLGIKEP